MVSACVDIHGMPLYEEDFSYDCLILLGSNYLIPTPPTEMTVNDEMWKKV